MGKSIIIIGAGLGGLSSGIYGQTNGYTTQIFEQNILPGGQCTAWKRQGYTFDVCIHHFFGASEQSKLYRVWKEIGAMPRPTVRPDDCVSVLSPDGKLFIDYYDLSKLGETLKLLSPADSAVIKEYLSAIRLFSDRDVMGEMAMGSFLSFLAVLFSRPSALKYLSLTLQKFGQKFSDPFLKRAFPLLVYSAPNTAMFLHLTRHAYGLNGVLQWPIGGAKELARSIEKRYLDLGVKIN